MRPEQKGFTLPELLVAMMIMLILAGTMTLSPNIGRQSTKNEAERVAAKMKSLTQRADRIKGSFDVVIEDNELKVTWHVEDAGKLNTTMQATTGCKYSSNTFSNYSVLRYPNSAIISVDTQPTGKYHIEITGAGTSPYYVAISGDNI